MTCDKAERLLPLLGRGDLKPKNARVLQEHLINCDRCAESARDYKLFFDLLHSTAGLDFDEELENELIEQSASPQNIEEWAMVRQQKALIEMAVARLPYKERTAFILRDFEGLSTEEVANALGVRTATVRVHISSARARVRRYCERLISRTKERSRNELRKS